MAAALAAGSAHAQDAALDTRARAIHQRIVVLDSHADVPDDLGVGAHEFAVDGDGQVDLPKLRRGGVAGVALAVFAPQGPRTPEGAAKAWAIADAKLTAIRAAAERHPDQAILALTPDEVLVAKRAGKVGLIPSFLNAYSLAEDVAAIDGLHDRGVRLFGLVHAGNNAFADSSRPAAGEGVEHGGLSPLGRAAVARLNRLGMLIDVSQLTRDGVLQTLELSRAPVVASHSGVQGIVQATRNLSDAELDAIAARKGVVQIVAFKSYLVRPPAGYDQGVAKVRAEFGLSPAFKGPNDGVAQLPAERRTDYAHALRDLLPAATVAHLADSIDYAVRRIGVAHVGIGSDFNHGGGVVGWANEGEAFGVTRELVRRGYAEADIAKLWGGNFLRVWGEAQAAA